mmetsp:Transcript_5947/g.15800  ORF Transcript_5947/g.15800 Transcript_5947/m.15800 type:complete len:115 (+) Transcript_5947:243-587(+)
MWRYGNAEREAHPEGSQQADGVCCGVRRNKGYFLWFFFHSRIAVIVSTSSSGWHAFFKNGCASSSAVVARIMGLSVTQRDTKFIISLDQRQGSRSLGDGLVVIRYIARSAFWSK